MSRRPSMPFGRRLRAAQPAAGSDTAEDARLGTIDERADDPVEVILRGPVGPLELYRVLDMLVDRRQTADADGRRTVDDGLHRLIAAAETLGLLDIVAKARAALVGEKSGD